MRALVVAMRDKLHRRITHMDTGSPIIVRTPGMQTYECQASHFISAIAPKSKGRVLLRDLAPAIRISKIWLGYQITTNCYPGVIRDLQARPALPALLRYCIRRKSSLPSSLGIQFPGSFASLVPDSLDD
jgi:hypothetical protein